MHHWTKKNHDSITITYLSDDKDDDNMSQPASITGTDEIEMEADEEMAKTDEFGRAIRQPKHTKDCVAISDTATTTSTSGHYLNSREMKSNASSSLTASTQLHNHGNSDTHNIGRIEQILPSYSDQVHSIRIPDSGVLMNAQQVNQLLQTVEQQALQVFSRHITTALAFHDPNTGIKTMIIEQRNLYHEAMKREIVSISNPKPTVHAASIPRTRSLNDIHSTEAALAPRIVARPSNINEENTTAINNVSEQEEDRNNKVQGSFAPTFNPPPEQARHTVI